MSIEKWIDGKMYTIQYFGKNQHGDIQIVVQNDERILDHLERIYQELESFFVANYLPGIEWIEKLTGEDFY